MAHSKLVYIAGPYSGPNVEANITRAIEAAVWCAEHRIFYFCPHMNSAYMDKLAQGVPTEFYYDMDLRIAETCTAVIMLPNYEQSKGAMGEYHYFARANKPIFYWPSEQGLLLDWYF